MWGSSLDISPSSTHHPAMHRSQPNPIAKAGLLIGNLAFWSTLGFGICLGLSYS